MDWLETPIWMRECVGNFTFLVLSRHGPISSISSAPESPLQDSDAGYAQKKFVYLSQYDFLGQSATVRLSPRNNRDRRSAPPDPYRHVRSKQDRPIFQPIYEQSPPHNRRRTRQISVLHELEEALRPDEDEDEHDENDADRSFFPWEDERTLIADLLHEE